MFHISYSDCDFFLGTFISHMVDDLHMRTEQENVDKSGENATGMARFKQMQVLDLEKNILQVKKTIHYLLLQSSNSREFRQKDFVQH